MNREEIIRSNPITAYLRSRGLAVEPKGKEMVSLCPFHDDHNPSLRINDEKGVYYCDVCGAKGTVIDLVIHFEQVDAGRAMKILSPDTAPVQQKKVRPRKVAEYVYLDVLGKPVCKVIRYEPKTFRQARPGPEGSWQWGMDGVQRVLYNLPTAIKSETVWIVEGEKDADNLSDLGFVATTNIGGAGKWLDAYTDTLEGKDIIIVPDNDAPGQAHMKRILKALAGKVKSVRIVSLPSQWKDVSDLITEKSLEAKSILDRLADEASVLHRGIDLPIYSMAEAERQYKQHLERGDEGALPLERWLPSLRKYRSLLPGELMVMIADTGQGKTAFLQNIARVSSPLNVLFFEIELPTPLLFERQMGINHGITGEEVESRLKKGPHLGRDNMEHIYFCPQAKLDLKQLEWLIVQSQLVIGQKPDVVMLDYIQLMGGGGSRYERMSDIADGLKRVARSTDTIMIIASQVHRPEKGAIAAPGLHSAKDSGNIENTAGLVLSLWRDDEDKRVAYVKILKCTKGEAGATITCNFEPSLRITERAWQGEADR